MRCAPEQGQGHRRRDRPPWYGGDATGNRYNIVKAAAIADFAPQRLDADRHIGNYPPQQVGSDVRFCLPEHFFRRTELNETCENIGAKRVVDTRYQLAVRKCARASRAELDI